MLLLWETSVFGDFLAALVVGIFTSLINWRSVFFYIVRLSSPHTWMEKNQIRCCINFWVALPSLQYTIFIQKIYLHFLSNWMEFDRGDSFPFNFKAIGISFGSKSKGKLSPLLYSIKFESKLKSIFLSVDNQQFTSRLCNSFESTLHWFAQENWHPNLYKSIHIWIIIPVSDG